MKLWTKTLSLIDLISYYEEIAYQLLKLRIGRRKYMTSMQVEYSKLKETQRANMAREQQQAAELAETTRYHEGTLYLNEKDLNEQIRHNIAQEEETLRSHLVSEREISLHNRISEALQREQNQLSKYRAELDSQTSITVTELKNSSEERKTQWTNASREMISAYDRISNEYIAESKNLVEWYKANTTDQKVRKEIELLQQDIDTYSARLQNETTKAAAALDQAHAALTNAALRGDELEEEKYMHDWQIGVDQFYEGIANTEIRQKGVSAAVNSAATLFRSALGLGTNNSKGGSNEKNTLGELVKSKSKAKK